jgi:hypothetical protein
VRLTFGNFSANLATAQPLFQSSSLQVARTIGYCGVVTSELQIFDEIKNVRSGKQIIIDKVVWVKFFCGIQIFEDFLYFLILVAHHFRTLRRSLQCLNLWSKEDCAHLLSWYFLPSKPKLNRIISRFRANRTCIELHKWACKHLAQAYTHIISY